jgi:hypothetical protein
VNFGPWKIMELVWKEYYIQVNGLLCEKGERTEFKAKGIAEEMEATW